jgi:hypothetical protein
MLNILPLDIIESLIQLGRPHVLLNTNIEISTVEYAHVAGIGF